MVATIEQRFRISQASFLKFVSEMEVSPFLDMGTVSPSVDQIQISKTHLSYGAAFRLVLRPQIVGAIDVAFGAEGPNTIIHVGYPF